MVQQRLAQLLEEKHKLMKELEFYRKDKAQVPARLQVALEDLERMDLEQFAALQSHNDEAVRISRRFDAELVRLESMWNRLQSSNKEVESK